MQEIRKHRHILCILLALTLFLSGAFGTAIEKRVSFGEPSHTQETSILQGTGAFISHDLGNADELSMVKGARLFSHLNVRFRQSQTRASLELLAVLLVALVLFCHYLELTDSLCAQGATLSHYAILRYIHRKDGAKSYFPFRITSCGPVYDP